MAPCLPARDLTETAAFYAALGFETVLIAQGGGYLIIRKDWVEMHFYPAATLDPKANPAGAYIRVKDVDAVVASFAAQCQPGEAINNTPSKYTPPQDREWGLREITIDDPNGNLIKIGSPISQPYPKP